MSATVAHGGISVRRECRESTRALAVKGVLGFLMLPVFVLTACSSAVSPDQPRTPTASTSASTSAAVAVDASSLTEAESLVLLGQEPESLEQVSAIDSTRLSDLVPWSKIQTELDDTTVHIRWWDAAQGCTNTVKTFVLTETPTDIIIDLQLAGVSESPTCPDSQSSRVAEIELSSPLADRTLKYHRPA
jgi:hypothetical protein